MTFSHPTLQHSRLKNLKIDFPILVAPMVGLSHVAFRETIRRYIPEGIDVLLFTEMLSSRRIPAEKLETANGLRRAKDEKHFVPQLLCNEEKFIAASLQKLAAAEPWGFDINMGCPVQKTLRHNWGVRLMGDPGYAAEVVSIARKYSDRPLSVKLRGTAADEESLDYLLNFTAKIEDAGADWLTVHPRPKERKHKGAADWSAVSEVAKARKIPVVANGDVQTVEDIHQLFSEHHVDGVMIARAMTARPWLIWQYAESIGYPLPPKEFTGRRAPTLEEEGQEYFAALFFFMDQLDLYFAEEAFKLHKLRFFIATGSRWFMFGHAFWRLSMKGQTLAEVRERIRDYADAHQHPMIRRITH